MLLTDVLVTFRSKSPLVNCIISYNTDVTIFKKRP